MPKNEHGIVGADKNADRQIIVWITNAILQAIQENKSTEKLGTLTLSKNPGKVWGCSMEDARKVWGTVTPSDICEKFKKAYNSKLFSKSKKYVLPYFDAVENILTEKNKDQLPALLQELSKSCEYIANSEISKRKALFTKNDKTFKEKMTDLHRDLEKALEALNSKATFSETLTNLLEEVERSNFWDDISGLSRQLTNLGKCFAAAYLDTEDLKIATVKFEKELPENCVLRAYPVLVSIYRDLENSKTGADIRAKLKEFLENRRKVLLDVLESPYKYSDHEYDADCSNIYNLLDTIK